MYNPPKLWGFPLFIGKFFTSIKNQQKKDRWTKAIAISPLKGNQRVKNTEKIAAIDFLFIDFASSKE